MIGMLGMVEPSLRRGFAYGKTLVRRKAARPRRAVGQDVKIANRKFEIFRLQCLSIAIPQSRKALRDFFAENSAWRIVKTSATKRRRGFQQGTARQGVYEDVDSAGKLIWAMSAERTGAKSEPFLGKNMSVPICVFAGTALTGEVRGGKVKEEPGKCLGNVLIQREFRSMIRSDVFTLS